MATSHLRRRQPLARKPDPSKAAQACRLLIRAYLEPTEQHDSTEIQDALAAALAAFQLPDDFIETDGGRYR